MKTLIYDNGCPLCAGYTAAFVKTGLLQAEGRKNFDEVPPALLRILDQGRMHNEIPLIDTVTGKTWYGIDALLELMAARIPVISKMGAVPLINSLLKKIYNLISFNRKLIVANDVRGYDCSPGFSLKYRAIFLLLGLVFNSWFFSTYTSFFNDTLFPGATEVQLQVAHFALVFVNILTAVLLGKRKGLDFLAQVNMLALLTLCLLLPVKLVSQALPLPAAYFTLGVLTVFVVYEYRRRMKFAGIYPGNLCVISLNIISVFLFIFYLLCR
ncbi:MAG: hypothetical protein EOO06_05025 [Chitinophagaceae bacterium]|nr:MAG: hypothetical protein EOO06_05025 [Chitinophagaceae bacterium]